jgi:hypothetical protein
MNSSTRISFIKEDPWRIFRIMAEFVDSFEALAQVGPGVTVFGSARMKPSILGVRTEWRLVKSTEIPGARFGVFAAVADLLVLATRLIE